MKYPKKIEAFTLTELLVTLAISTIVVGLAFVVMNLISRNIQSIQNNYNYSAEMSLVEQQITIDFNRYHSISYKTETNILHLKTPLDSITYEFQERLILRNLDTLTSGNYQKELYFDGNKTINGLVDALKISLTEDGTENSLFLFKENDAVQFMTTANGN